MAAPIPLAGGAADGGGEDSAAAAGASLATRSRATINGRHDGQDVGRWQPPRGGSRRGSELAEGWQSQEAPEIDKRSSHGAQGSTEDGGRSEKGEIAAVRRAGPFKLQTCTQRRK